MLSHDSVEVKLQSSDLLVLGVSLSAGFNGLSSIGLVLSDDILVSLQKKKIKLTQYIC